MGLVVKLQTMQQLTILVTFFKSEEHSYCFIAWSSINFIIIVINCLVTSKLDHQKL